LVRGRITYDSGIDGRNARLYTPSSDAEEFSMSTDLSVESLSTPEKLALMERLWESLSQRPPDVPSPAWHGSVLAERIAAVREGRTSFVDWEDAKKRLQARGS
jgi:putative addiction module component (TIGR02574 family)